MFAIDDFLQGLALMRPFAVLALAAVAAAPAAKPAAPPAANPNAIAVALPPDSPHHALLDQLQQYAAATGTVLGDVAWDGASLDGVHADLVLATGEQAQAACRAGSIARIDWNRLGHDRYLPIATSDCAAGAYVSTIALAWDHQRLDGTANWGDFWNVAQHPGRRGLQRSPRGTLEIALLADGVAPADIYRTLRSNDGVDRAFRKLDQLKPYIQWWDSPDQPAQLLGDGKVLLTTAPVAGLAAAAAASHHHFDVQWAGSLTELRFWVMPKDSQRQTAAHMALLVAGDLARQAVFAENTQFGPVVNDALTLMPPDARAASPSAPAHLQAGLMLDDGFWIENRARLEARFTAWIGK
jgi:putative spermidine/putrescine transport system substrate-binding protein